MHITKKTKILIAGLTVAGAAAVAGAGIAGAGSDDDAEAPITGTELDRASAAALAETGGGEVTETEVGDEESLYEVEVTLDDGTQVDVQVDEDFNVVSTEADGHDDEGADDD
jgi:uncharacterized membrane protein YkoI